MNTYTIVANRLAPLHMICYDISFISKLPWPSENLWHYEVARKVDIISIENVGIRGGMPV